MSTDEQAVGIPEIAAMLRVSEDTIRRRVKTGDLPGFKVGRVWRFWPSAVREAVTPKPVDPWAMPEASKRARRAA
jgi:excisionase family DNA binding protein